MIKHKIIFRQGYLEHTFYDVMSIGIADSDKNTIFFFKISTKLKSRRPKLLKRSTNHIYQYVAFKLLDK